MADEANNDAEVFMYTEGVTVPRDVVYVQVHPSVTVIPPKAFQLRQKLEDVELCEGLLEIGNDAFYECVALKRITIPSTVTTIGGHAFGGCTKLEDVTLCEGLVEMGEAAFLGCTAVKQIRIPLTVTVLPPCVFKGCERLEKVELCEGLFTIGRNAFYGCYWMTKIVIPTTVKTIGEWSFAHVPLESLSLPDGIESMGEDIFCNCRFPTFRLPHLITTISKKVFYNCKSMFSLELPDSINQIDQNAFEKCASLRNITLPSNAEKGRMMFEGCRDLQQLFDSEEETINALKLRFDNLPIHKMIYYHSYNNLTADQLDDATSTGHCRTLRSSQLDPTGSQQDCLGMTPLHILACSAVQHLDLYKVLVEKFPENLITKDRWGALPLLYVTWGNAPSEIVQYLVERYKSFYPNYEFDWTGMVTTLGLANAPTCSFIRLIHKKREESFPDQQWGDWDTALEKAVAASDENDPTCILRRTFCVLVVGSITKRAKAIGSKVLKKELRDYVFGDVPDGIQQRKDFITVVQTTLGKCEEEYSKLKEATSMIELVLWKIRMNDCFSEQKYETRRFKKMKLDKPPDIRHRCRVTCGAGTVIEHVLPYLLPKSKRSDE